MQRGCFDMSERAVGQALRLRLIAVFVKALILAVTVAGLVGCWGLLYRTEPVVRTGTVRISTLRHIESLDMDRAAPVLIRMYKEESTLEVWKQDRTGKFAMLKSYRICKFSGKLGPKIVEGDHQAPEGFYDITPEQMNPLSNEYLSFNIGFPNAFDRSLGRTGNFLMVHGGCRSVGCYAMTDYEMEEIYGLVEEAFKGVQDKIQLQAFTFRVTTQNFARHAADPNAPFWQVLKMGSDAFFETRLPPSVAVSCQNYVFNSAVTGNGLGPSAPCPPGINSTPVADALQAPAKLPLYRSLPKIIS